MSSTRPGRSAGGGSTGSEGVWPRLFPAEQGVRDDIKRILASIGEDDTKTPSERSPEWFDKVPFKENKEWHFWRLHDRRSQEKRRLQ